MPSSSSSSPRRRRASAGLAMLLYLGVAVAAPLAHARSEVLRSRPEVEAKHTSLCARIHTEAACLVGITFQVLSPPARALAAEAPQRFVPPAGERETPVIRLGASSRHPVRAPPAS